MVITFTPNEFVSAFLFFPFDEAFVLFEELIPGSPFINGFRALVDRFTLEFFDPILWVNTELFAEVDFEEWEPDIVSSSFEAAVFH